LGKTANIPNSTTNDEKEMEVHTAQGTLLQVSLIDVTLGASGFFFCSETAIVSGEATISIAASPLTIAASPLIIVASLQK